MKLCSSLVRLVFSGVIGIPGRVCLATEPWVPYDCGSQFSEAWGSFSQQMAAAEPGSEIYVPYPYPTTNQQVVQDAVYSYNLTFGGTPMPEMPDDEQEFAQAIRSGSYTTQVIRFENWNIDRCRDERPAQYGYLVRFFAANVEVGRYAVAQTGLPIAWSSYTQTDGQVYIDRWRNSILSLTAANTYASQHTTRYLTSSQYVWLRGTIACTPTSPCVVGRGPQNEVLLIAAGDVWQVLVGSREYSQDEVLSSSGDILAGLASDEGIAFVGFGRTAVARRLFAGGGCQTGGLTGSQEGSKASAVPPAAARRRK